MIDLLDFSSIGDSADNKSQWWDCRSAYVDEEN